MAASCVVPLDDVAGRLGSHVCKDKLSTTVGCLGVTERNLFSATLEIGLKLTLIGPKKSGTNKKIAAECFKNGTKGLKMGPKRS